MLQNASLKRTIATQTDAVIYFFKKLDDEMIGDLLSDDLMYQELPKDVFIRKLGDLFFSFKELGDTMLFGANEIDGFYDGTEVVAITFIGNKSRMFIDIIFEVDGMGNILDMYEYEDPDSDREMFMWEGRLFIDNYEIGEEDYWDNENF